MKAIEVLKRYQAGARNFQDVNLRGQSFRGKNLSGADFTGADFTNAKLQGTKFTNATLIKADFTDAECGLLYIRLVVFMVILFLLLGISGAASGLAGMIASNLLVPLQSKGIYSEYTIPAIAVPTLLTVFLITTIRRGLTQDIAILAGIVALTVAVSEVLAYLIFGYKGLVIGSRTAWELAGAGATLFGWLTQ